MEFLGAIQVRYRFLSVEEAKESPTKGIEKA